eukprot:Skav209980  [mRNA]  locus=scaffold1046:180997:182227:+ [translate_table: standard]
MARRTALPALILGLVAAIFLSNAFVAPPSSTALRGATPVVVAAAAAVPQMAQAVDVDVGSSLNISAPLEALPIGIVLGTVPITVLGLFVSAWLQFKKGPTLGI